VTQGAATTLYGMENACGCSSRCPGARSDGRGKLSRRPAGARETRASSGLRNVEAGRPLRRVVVSERDRVIFVPLDDVTHLPSEGNYVRVCTRLGSHLIRDTLTRAVEAREALRVPKPSTS